MKDYYALLGVEQSATKLEIKKNDRQLTTKFQPDKNPDPAAPTKFIEITEAYNVLSDKKGRARYDLARWQEMKRQRERAQGLNTESYVSGSFATVMPPRVSSRTRRNIAQKKRGKQYQLESSSFRRFTMVLIESVKIVGRYTFHIMGVALFGFILYSMWSDLLDKRMFSVIVITTVLGYVLYKIVEDAVGEFVKDMHAYSVFFALTKRSVYSYCLLVLVAVLGIVGVFSLWTLR